MNLQHTEDRRMLADMLNRFIAEQYGFAERTRIAYAGAGYSDAQWRRFAEQGVLAALFGERAGGLGGAGFDIAVVFEALGRGLVVEPFLGALMAGSVLAEAGPAPHPLVDELIAGTAVAALAHEEAGGYAPARVATRARRDGDHWVLDGAKAMVPCGESAGHFVVSARTAGDEYDPAGISLFLVPAGAAGLQVRGCAAIDGGRVADLALAGVRVPDDARLGEAHAAYPLLEAALARGVLALCAEAVGAMDAVRDATLDYLRTRTQFGVPIGRFQALQHRMTELAIEVEQARSAVINAAAALDGEDRLQRERAMSAAKYTIGRVGSQVAEESIQMHGGIGMTWELPLAHHAKRLVMIDHQLGDEDEHLARYIALGRE